MEKGLRADGAGGAVMSAFRSSCHYRFRLAADARLARQCYRRRELKLIRGGPPLLQPTSTFV